MTTDLLAALGGVGLFLVGMIMMTDALRGLAGRRVRGVLARFTATPLHGAITGALTAAIVQSSSATTVTAVGFVGAGLMTFPQALGVIFGANIGTTVTGWLVVLLGFKLDLGEIVLPLVLAGALLRLLTVGRLAILGAALAGFSLLFIGIDAMKDGLGALEGVVTPADFPDDTIPGRLLLVAIGSAITLVTQSSSAGIATLLAGLGSGAIDLSQAANLLIGMHVGTSSTAVLATIGGSTTARRTGIAHVIYNLMTGAIAFLVLPILVSPRTGVGLADTQVALVAFHSSFTVLGVALVLPFTGRFARLVEALVPESGPPLTRRLDEFVLSDRGAAMNVAAATIDDLSRAADEHLLAGIAPGGGSEKGTARHDALLSALRLTRSFVTRIPPSGDAPDQLDTMLHILDHLERLLYRCEQHERIAALARDRRLRRLRALLASQVRKEADPDDASEVERRLDKLRRLMRRQRKRLRNTIIAAGTGNRLEDDEVSQRLDALRWLHRVAYHLWRIRRHLNRLDEDATERQPLSEAHVDVSED